MQLADPKIELEQKTESAGVCVWRPIQIRQTTVEKGPKLWDVKVTGIALESQQFMYFLRVRVKLANGMCSAWTHLTVPIKGKCKIIEIWFV
jgi:hypothetical protein